MNVIQQVSPAPEIAKRNSWILTVAQAFGGANAPVVVSLGGLVGQQLSPDPDFITLPVSLLNLGLALGTLPAAYVMRRFGRRAGYLLGTVIGMVSGMIAAAGIVLGSFIIFCLGTCLAGFYSSYVQSYRFAATDNASGAESQKAIARVMIGGLAAAIIGPQLVIWTRDAVPGTPFAGSFVSQAALAALAFPILFASQIFTAESRGPERRRGAAAFPDTDLAALSPGDRHRCRLLRPDDLRDDRLADRHGGARTFD